MASYAGALAAIKERLSSGWTTTPICYLNEGEPTTVRPDTGETVPVSAYPVPWALLEVVNTSGEIISAGIPGNHVVLYEGLIYVHVFVPILTGVEQAFDYAGQIGEIFRAAKFYDDGASYIRTWTPRSERGDVGSDDGQWFRVSMCCPYEYYHRG